MKRQRNIMVIVLAASLACLATVSGVIWWLGITTGSLVATLAALGVSEVEHRRHGGGGRHLREQTERHAPTPRKRQRAPGNPLHGRSRPTVAGTSLPGFSLEFWTCRLRGADESGDGGTCMAIKTYPIRQPG